MKKISWRILTCFGIVLIVFTFLTGLLFTKFNRRNIVNAYKKQLSNLAVNVANETSAAEREKGVERFQNYLRTIEGYAEAQNIDVWVVSNPDAKWPLSEDYTNVAVESVTIPAETTRILQCAYNGKKKSYYSDYDDIYKMTMLHLAVPVYHKSGKVMGAVLVSGPMTIQENTISQYEKYMIFCVASGLVIAIVLALYFSRQLAMPIIKMKEFALALAAGEYGTKTGISRRDEIGSLAESMDTLSDRLVEAEKLREGMEQTRRDFFSNVSHELRTPITVMKGYADSLADGVIEEPEKQQEYLSRIRRECDSMETLVSDLLILSRMQNPEYKLTIEVLNVIAVAQDAIRSLRILMKEREMEGVVEYSDACCFIEGDYDRIRQLFVILLQNAVKYADEKTVITVRINREHGWIKAVINDFGSIIPEEEQEHVFEKFYRASNTGKKDGSGLGLVVASQIVQRHGGKIYVSSTEEEGTSFFVEFPETSEKIS